MKNVRNSLLGWVHRREQLKLDEAIIDTTNKLKLNQLIGDPDHIIYQVTSLTKPEQGNDQSLDPEKKDLMHGKIGEGAIRAFGILYSTSYDNDDNLTHIFASAVAVEISSVFERKARTKKGPFKGILHILGALDIARKSYFDRDKVYVSGMGGPIHSPTVDRQGLEQETNYNLLNEALVLVAQHLGIHTVQYYLNNTTDPKLVLGDRYADGVHKKHSEYDRWTISVSD